MKEFTKDSTRYAIKFSEDDVKDGLTFFSQDGDFLQVGSWNYAAGKELKAHNHNIFDRSINRTQEFVFVLRGSVMAKIYDESNQLIANEKLSAHEGLILLAGGHGYEILEDQTKVIEAKNGPYFGPERDRKRL